MMCGDSTSADAVDTLMDGIKANRVEVYKDREVKIHFKVSAEQYLGKIARIA